MHANAATIASVERKIQDTFRKRDALMEEATRTGRYGRVNVLEAYASLQQTILAGLVESSDPDRAARLRAEVATNA